MKIYPSAALGYRAWMLSDDQLLSLNARGIAWEPGENIARCFKDLHEGDHKPPSPDCHCGFNAYNELSRVERMIFILKSAASARLTLPRRYVIGAVAGYGDTQVHVTGWRAERARIIAISGVCEAWRLTQSERDDLTARYGMPIATDSEDLVRLASAYHPTPIEARPDITGRRKNAGSRLIDL